MSTIGKAISFLRNPWVRNTLMFLIALVILPLALIFGLNLMGIAIPYTVKSIFGAAIVIFIFKSHANDKSKHSNL